MFAFSILVWVVSLLAIVLAGLLFVLALNDLGQPSFIDGALLAVAVAVIPYCFARGISDIVRLRALEDERQAREQGGGP